MEMQDVEGELQGDVGASAEDVTKQCLSDRDRMSVPFNEEQTGPEE